MRVQCNHLTGLNAWQDIFRPYGMISSTTVQRTQVRRGAALLQRRVQGNDSMPCRAFSDRRAVSSLFLECRELCAHGSIASSAAVHHGEEALPLALTKDGRLRLPSRPCLQALLTDTQNCGTW